MKIDTAEFVRSAVARHGFVRDDLPQVSFIGRSNVGKSSLMNRLLGRKGLARTSSTPGRTRTINYFLINRRFYFTDLPGYGYARASRQDRQGWAQLVDHYFQAAGPQIRVVLLVDAKVGATPLDVQAVQYLKDLGCAFTVAATKIDRVTRGRRAATLAGIRESLELGEEAGLVPVSAQTGEGIPELWKHLQLHLKPGTGQIA